MGISQVVMDIARVTMDGVTFLRQFRVAFDHQLKTSVRLAMGSGGAVSETDALVARGNLNLTVFTAVRSPFGGQTRV